MDQGASDSSNLKGAVLASGGHEEPVSAVGAAGRDRLEAGLLRLALDQVLASTPVRVDQPDP